MSSDGTPITRPLSRTGMIAERQRRYPLWRLIHLLGSLKLALLLLATIAIAIGAATFTEAHFDAAVARAWIYKAPWFIAWLGVLCINLFAVTLTRWPWQKKHTGFIITHYGIITLLIGAVIGSRLGFEGNVTLRTDGQPQRRIITDISTLQIESPADSYLYLLPFDAKLAHPTEKHPKRLSIPGTKLEMVIDDSSEHLIRHPRLQEGTSPNVKSLLLDCSSSNLNQELPIGLGLKAGSDPVSGSPPAGDAPDRYDFFGLASITFHEELPHHGETGNKLLDVTAGSPPVQGVSLSRDGRLVTIRSDADLSATYDRSVIMNKVVALGTHRIVVREYLTNSTPVTPPSIRVEIQAHEDKRAGVGEGETTADSKPWLELAPAAKTQEYGHSGEIAWQLGRSGEVTSSGILKQGDSMPLGWADWRLKLREVATGKSVTSVMEPGSSKEQGGVPGFHAYLIDPSANPPLRGDSSWVASGEVTPLLLENDLVRVGYGLELRPIPFSISLKDFQVPRDEGTETPSDFRATVQFKNLATGVESTGLIRMNHPASYPGGLIANMTGINYKFSQAEWNPRDLKETTLQVLYDPGWFFKWTGSLAICLGIATMFYIKPRS